MTHGCPSRGLWVQDPRTGELIPKHLYSRGPVARSDLPAPMVISDQIDGVWNPANGRRYDSKRAYYKAVRASRCEIIGTEKLRHNPGPEMPSPSRDIAEAIAEVSARAGKPRKRRKLRAA